MPLRAEDVVVPFSDPAVTHGFSVFETVRVDARGPVALELHLTRLAGSCAATGIAMPDGTTLTHEIAAAAAGTGVALVRVRVTLTGGGLRIVTAAPADPARIGHPVRAVRGWHRDDPVLPGFVKHGSRASSRVAVDRSGVDEVLLIDERGRFTEGTTSAVLAVIDGALWTAPDDGRILPSTACAEVLDRAHEIGIPVLREGPPSDYPWDGLYIASSLRDLCPVIELDGKPLPAWDAIGALLRPPSA